MYTHTPSLQRSYVRTVVRLVALAVALHGLLIIAGTLVDQFTLHRGHLHVRFSDDAFFGAPLIIGLTLLYLSSLLRRRKQLAWLAAVSVYALVVLLGVVQLVHFGPHARFVGMHIVRNVVLPLLLLGGLLLSRRDFTVKSDIRSFRQSLGFIVIVLAVTFLYGVVGFMLMDKHDFHHEIGFWEAAHHTVDQFGLTTNHALVPYTRRARVFVDSLSVISIGALAYTLISLFQPLKARFRDQSHNRARVRHLLETHPASSEDFFKLWPTDKVYYLNGQQTAAIALRVERSVALIVGDPAGQPADFDGLLTQFLGVCDGSDWLPAFIHTEPKHNALYERHDFSLQKIGEEAVLDLAHFQSSVAGNKYFRQIRSKFDKQGYRAELLQPPHDKQLVDSLRLISQEWLQRPGREERGFMMGYFSPEYMQQCAVMVARDGDGQIQAFINQIPSFDKHEANFDLLRSTNASLTNINDFLLMNFIGQLQQQGFLRLNLGLCPLVGLDKKDENDTLIDSALRFVYANGDRFYSFSGLKRFKAKYEPEWSDRYIAYRGGVRGFTRTLNALNRAMKVKRK